MQLFDLPLITQDLKIMTSEPKPIRSYSQEDVQQILHLAIARQADDQDKEFSYQEILEIASELEIAPECLQIAERDWLSNRGEVQQRQAFNSFRRTRFKKRFGNYAIVNTVLVMLDLMTGGGLTWSLYILTLWGLGVGLNGWNSFQTEGEDYEIAFQKWNRNHQVKKLFNSVWTKWLKAWQI